MSTEIIFTAADQALCLAVLKQIEVGRIDYLLIQQELGLPTKASAQLRWCRFKAKLNGKKSTKTSSRTHTPPKTKAISKSKKGSANKKRKLESSEEEEGSETPPTSQGSAKEDGDADGDTVMEASETPTRKLPGRRARATNFKDLEGESDDEGQEEADDEKEEDIEDCGDGRVPETAEPVQEAQSDDEV